MTLIPLSVTGRIAPSLNSLVKTLRSPAIANPPHLDLGLHTILTHCPIWWDQTNLRIEMPNPFLRLIPHPLAVITHIFGKALGTLPFTVN